MKFFEHDKYTNDEFICEITRIIKPETKTKGEEIIIKPGKLDDWFKEKIIDKDWLNERVYADLKLKPMQTLTPAFKRTNFVEFNI